MRSDRADNGGITQGYKRGPVLLCAVMHWVQIKKSPISLQRPDHPMRRSLSLALASSATQRANTELSVMPHLQCSSRSGHTHSTLPDKGRPGSRPLMSNGRKKAHRGGLFCGGRLYINDDGYYLKKRDERGAAATHSGRWLGQQIAKTLRLDVLGNQRLQ